MKNRSSLIIIFFTIFLDLLGFGIIIPILPNLAVGLGGNANALAIAALYAGMNFLFSPFWGTLSDRYGRRPIILISIAITAVANFYFGFVNSLIMLAVQRTLAGIGSANISAANAYVADISDPSNRAKNMGLIGAAFGLGFIFGPVIGGSLMEGFGLMGVGLVSGGLSLLNLVLAFFLLPESLKEKAKNAAISIDPITPLFKAMENRLVRGMFLLNFIFIAAFSLMQVTAALLWHDHFGLGDKETGYMFTFIGLCSVIVQGAFVGPLNKRFGEKKLLAAGFVFMIAGLVSLPYYTSIWGELVGLFVIALANGMISPSILSLLSGATGPKEQGKILGLNQGMGSLGRVAGPLIGGPLYAWHYEVPYLGGGFLLLMALLFTFDIYRKKILNKDAQPQHEDRKEQASPAARGDGEPGTV